MGVGVAGTQQGGAAAGDETERMEALAQYCERQSASEPAVLSRLRAETLAVYAHSPGAARMLSDSLQGRVLAMLTTVSRAEQVLELGAFTGYSAICMALGLEGDLAAVATGTRRVLTCEPDPQARCIAQRHIDEAGLQGRIDLRDIKAAELLEELQQDPAAPMLDLVFLDADKKQYTTYLRTLMGDKDNDDETKGRVLLKDGALIVVDNTLWKGLVLEAEVADIVQLTL